MRHESKASALWGSGNRGGDRRRDVRRLAVLVAVVATTVLAAGVTGTARADDKNADAFVPTSLLNAAAANPNETFDVIVRGQPGEKSASIATYFNEGGGLGKLKHEFYSIAGVAGSLSGADLVKLAKNNHVFSITPDSRTASAATTPYVNQEAWRQETGIDQLWGTLDPLTGLRAAPQAPAIAVVDSGVDSSKIGDFGTRVVASVNFSLAPAGDQQGHGTMVAGLAAGASPVYPGVAQNAPIVDLKTADATGASRMSDVIAACDWILQHETQYNIHVANFSMRSGTASSFRYDPLDAAVESLWFNGVVVVAAVGNYGTGTGPVSIQYSPGNDPFVISVGALDVAATSKPKDDFVAPWSAYGHTPDAFSKPELSAPGRWMIAPVPIGSYLATTAPDRVMAPGYMWMSGTSLAAPIVSGAAAQLLARNPTWTPDQVKGALMRSASGLPLAPNFAGGVGEVNAPAAAAVVKPPNPNRSLDRFITTDPVTGKISFDQASWQAAAKLNSAWNATDWSATDWSATDWSATDWSATVWSAATWVATDWSATTWSATDWSATDWSATDWSA